MIQQHWPTEVGNYLRYYEAIYHQIREAATAPVSAGEGISIVLLIEAALQSSLQQRVIQLK
jgi:predicted dehydrogenase